VTLHSSDTLFVFHATQIVSGPNAETVYTTYVLTGRYLIETKDPAIPDFTGRYLDRGTGSFRRSTYSDTVTFMTIAHAPDGALLRLWVHWPFNVTPDGMQNSISFEAIDCPFE
jgi:hypothetical protein